MDNRKYRDIIVLSGIVGFFVFLTVLFVNELDSFIQWFGDALVNLFLLVL